MRNIFDSTSAVFALIAALSATLISTAARAEDRLPLIVTEGLHSTREGLTESLPVKTGDFFSVKDEQLYNKTERQCVESQIDNLKKILGTLKDVKQVTIVLNKDGRLLRKRYVELKQPENSFLSTLLGNDKPTLEVGGIVSYNQQGIPADCTAIDPLTIQHKIQQAIYRIDVSIIDSNKSVSKREGDKPRASRAPAAISRTDLIRTKVAQPVLQGE